VCDVLFTIEMQCVVIYLCLFYQVLFLQFSRLANLYTLVIVCLSVFSFSPITPLSSVTPLAVVVFTSAIKEAVEDVKRHKADKEVNGRETTRCDYVSKNHQWVTYISLITKEIQKTQRDSNSMERCRSW
jgi:hypothetical protein